jgi:hypothetical protein
MKRDGVPDRQDPGNENLFVYAGTTQQCSHLHYVIRRAPGRTGDRAFPPSQTQENRTLVCTVLCTVCNELWTIPSM